MLGSIGVSERVPSVSVLVVSDYGGRTSDDWNYLRETLAALRAQSFDEPFETILVDATPAGEPMPPDLVVPGQALRIVREPGATSCELMNRAVETAASDVVALLDGDCAPVAGWLAAGVACLRAHPQAVAVSGRTVYRGESFRSRVLAVLSRSFVDPGGPGATRFISACNALVRRSALLSHPLGAPPRALAARLQTEAIRMDGGALRFAPGMRVAHRFEGWPMERRMRRNIGYRAVRIRQIDPRLPYAWVVRLGALSVPLIVAARTLDSFRDCIRVGAQYGVRWFELPPALAIAVAVHLLEIGGMRAALAEGRAARARS
jgi:Glycosyl transferase family 2